MTIVQIKAYGHGFTGIACDGRDYLFFIHSRKGVLKIISRYPVADFIDLEHFKVVMHKFILPTTFLAQPVPVSHLGLSELERVCQKAGKRRPA